MSILQISKLEVGKIHRQIPRSQFFKGKNRRFLTNLNLRIQHGRLSYKTVKKGNVTFYEVIIE